ncbi:hypothetical protein ACFV0T_20795 [Streptomyces sp. NPDC059582]|uniref:hypothetical protein n=1 Tax=Streptomyces sp. NPDC059582 TaxID=3346875 RepID=UPI0036B7F709
MSMPMSTSGAEHGPVSETFAFACGDCGHVWEAVFRVMFFTNPTDAAGLTTQEYVDEHGRAVRTPLSEAVCPDCGGRRVRVTSPGSPGRGHDVGHDTGHDTD